MDTKAQGTSGPDSNAGGISQEIVAETQNGAASGEADAGYPKHFVEKLKKEKLNAAQRAQQLANELEEVRAAQASAQENELQQKEQFKQLWEQEKLKAKSYQEQLTQLKVAQEDQTKKSAIKQQLLNLGLNPKHEATAFRLMDTSPVVLDDTGNVLGAEEAARSFYDQFRDLGLFGQQTPGVSQRAPKLNTVGEKPVREMSQDEIRQKLKELQANNK